MKFTKIPGKDFEMSIYQCTQGDWTEVMSDNPSKFKGINNPVECVSFYDVQEFINKLNEKQKEYIYRLPTEEEWEYCCRAGSTSDYCFGDSEEELLKYAWFYKNSDNETHPVGKKFSNIWGLYDMHGNVWEWTSSLLNSELNSDGSAQARVMRGGGFNDDAQFLRSACRYYGDPGDRDDDLGFRLVRTLISTPITLLPSTVYEIETTTRELFKLLKNKKLRIKVEVIK